MRQIMLRYVPLEFSQSVQLFLSNICISRRRCDLINALLLIWQSGSDASFCSHVSQQMVDTLNRDCLVCD